MPTSRAVESVWDYPRPAVLEPFGGRIRIEHQGVVLADTVRAFRVLETSHPPTYYLPPDDVDVTVLRPNNRQTFCEWKGAARYFDLSMGGIEITSVAWTYPDPTPSFAAIRNYLSFYPSRIDACFIDGERVQPQEGDFYGGWITASIRGPFKGAPGTGGW